MRGIEEKKGTSVITDIQVGNLSLDAITGMISDLLYLPQMQCAPLATVIYNQTQGNALFTIQFLRSLEENGTLYMDESKGGVWAWKPEALIVAMEGTGSDELMVQLLANKLKDLPSFALDVVKVASCLSNSFSREILCNSGVTSEASQVEAAIDVADEHGVFEYDFDSDLGRFSHDKFKEAAYSLIPDTEKSRVHLNIAQSLKRQLTPNASKRYVAVILNQISAGIDELKDPAEREQWACICLKACRKAGKAASFVAAREYVELGIRLLERRHWRDQYHLSLSTGHVKQAS